MVDKFIYIAGAISCGVVGIFIIFVLLVLIIATIRVFLHKDRLSVVEQREPFNRARIKASKANPEKEQMRESVVAVLTRPDGKKKTIQRRNWYQFWK